MTRSKLRLAGCNKDLILSILVICLSRYLVVAHPSTSNDRPEMTTNAASGSQSPSSDYPVDLSGSHTVTQSVGPSSTAEPSLPAISQNDATTRDSGSTTSASPNATLTSRMSNATVETRMPTSPRPMQTFTSSSQTQQEPQPHCTLGDDIFQIGERWNPNLPPFGVQVCVLCECTIRQRKSCYEAKVTCRRITNECPVIDSCPDGKKPVTVAGHCCKSCQSTALSQHESNLQVPQEIQSTGYQSSAYEAQASSASSLNHAPLKIVYMNERTKEYLSMMKSLPQCPNRDSEAKQTGTSPTTPAPPPVSKAPKGSRNDLNGIDTRLAFKSLHDSASNYQSSAKSHSEADEKVTTISRRVEQHSEDHHQHPNDVQSASGNSNNIQQQVTSSNYGRTNGRGSSGLEPAQASPSHCILGNDTFQVGDVWNPILPPFGVQLCVQCNCIFRVRKGCYETKLTCRRVTRDCPVIGECPDGKPPVTVSGQCCKSCQTTLNNIEQQPVTIPSSTTTISPTMPLDGIQRNEKVSREFAAVSRNLDVCVRTRESVDIYNTNRYARRSQMAR